MTPRKHSSHTDDIISTLRDKEAVQRFSATRLLLQQHLVHKRTIPNGRDFLFQGPHDELHESLRQLVEIERSYGRFLQFDYAQVEEYFLLRVVGSEQYQHAIANYFD